MATTNHKYITKDGRSIGGIRKGSLLDKKLAASKEADKPSKAFQSRLDALRIKYGNHIQYPS